MAPDAKRFTIDVDRLDLLDRHGLQVRELEQVAQRHGRLGRRVDGAGVLPEDGGVVRARGLLELVDRGRVVEVPLAALAPLVEAAGLEVVVVLDLHGRVGGRVAHERLALHGGDVDAADPGHRPGERVEDERVGEPHRLEDLGPDVGGDRRDPHLRHRLEESLAHGLQVVLAGLLGGQALRQHLAAAHVLDRVEREVGVDRGGAEPEEAREVVHLARLARLDDEAAPGAQALADEVVVNGRDGQERGDRGVVGVHRAVGEDEDLVAVLHVLLGLAPQAVERPLHAARLGLEAQGQRLGLEVLAVHPAQPLEVLVGEHGLRQLDDPRVLGAVPQDVALAPDEGDEAHDQLLADGVDRGVGHLGEELVEVVEEVPRLVGEDREGRVVAHRAHRLLAVPRHRGHQDPQVLERVAEDPLLREDAAGRGLEELAGRRQLGEGDLPLRQPLRVGPLGADAGLDLVVRDDAALLEGRDEHPARPEPALADDLLRGHVEDSRLRGHDEHVVVGQAVARGPQPVAVEGRADERPVRERDRGRDRPRAR